MAVEWQFLLTELMVACAAIMTLLAILALVFWMEGRTPGPVFSRQAVRAAALDRDTIKYHDAERDAARVGTETGAIASVEKIAEAIADRKSLTLVHAETEHQKGELALTA